MHKSLLVRKELPAGNLNLELFTLANVNDERVFVIGGLDHTEECFSAAVHMFRPSKSMWFEVASLNVARSEHSSCAMHDDVYVFCGWNGSEYLNSIEMFKSSQENALWEIFSIDAISCRNSPVVCPLSDTELLIMGGYAGANYLNDVLILDRRSRTAQCVLTVDDKTFGCQSQSYMVEDGCVVALVSDRMPEPYFVRYSKETNELTAFPRVPI